MAGTYDEVLDAYSIQHGVIASQAADIFAYKNLAYLDWAAGDYPGAIINLIICANITSSALARVAKKSSLSDNQYYAIWLWQHGSAAYMDTIIETMMGAEFHQIEQFIGLVDAYRTTLWNKPFDWSFYATTVRLFIE